jgi:hypothetical protein
MGGLTQGVDLPTVKWMQRLADAMTADADTFRKLGEIDCRMAVSILDGAPDGSRLSVQVTFEELSVVEIKEIEESELDSMDFVIETDQEVWQEMVDNISAGDGRPDLEHTLNALSITGIPVRVWSSDTLGKDMFFRYNQSLQQFFNNCART